MTFLTGAPGRPDRFFTLTRHSDPEHDSGLALSRPEREQIARAAVLAAARGARIDEGDIANILSQTVDQRGLSVTDIMVRAASMAEQYTGRQAFNWHSATPDQARRYLASLGLEPGWRRAMRDAERLAASRSSARDADDGDDGVGSSLRFDDTFLRSPAGREMQAYARDCGLDWAMNRPEILRLGREAIALFARTGFRQESFDGLREVGFEGRQIERLARFAERSGQDANEVARVTRNSIRSFGGGNPEREREWREMLDNFHDNAGNDESWRRLDGALSRMEREGTAEQQAQARQQREVAERARQAEAQAKVDAAVAITATTQANTTTATANIQEAQVDGGIDALNGPAPATQRPLGQQPTPHVAGPR